MLEEPSLPHADILAALREEYGLSATGITFLPLGADVNTAVYRIAILDNAAYFLKLRSGPFDEASVAVPRFLRDAGMKYAIPPLTTQAGQLWGSLPPFKTVLYPYVDSHNAYESQLSEQQWTEFGTALKAFHTAHIPPAISSSTPRETFSPRWRSAVRLFLERIQNETFSEPIAAQLAAFLRSKAEETLRLVDRAGQLAQSLEQQPHEYILCHGDIHGWNLLIDMRGALYIVDWDTLIFAPRERDLMFIGAGLGDTGRTPDQEEALFYRGYGQVDLNRTAIAYYRYERIIEDIATYCEQVFLSDSGGEDREQALEFVRSNFLAGSTIERARDADDMLKGGS